MMRFLQRLRVLFAFFLLCSLLLTTGGCTAQTAEENFFAMDTLFTVRLYGREATRAMQTVKQTVQDFQSRYDVRSESSEVAKINRNAGQWVEVSDDTIAQIALVSELSLTLPNAFCLSLYPVTALWGFGTNHAAVPSEQALAQALQAADDSKIEVDFAAKRVRIPVGTALDFGGITKGYLGKILTELLSSYDLIGAYLSLGGNVQLYQNKPDGSPWRIGITDPHHPSSTVGVLTTDAKAVVTSGSYQRYFTQDGVRYHHILDPQTGRPSEKGCASVTVITPNGAWADALSTAFFVSGYEATVAYWQTHTEIEFVYITDEQQVFVSEGIAPSFALSDPNASFITVVRQNG